MKPSMLLLLFLSATTIYAQKSTWNKADRKYICDKLNKYLDNTLGKNDMNEKLWNENDPRLLSDTFAMRFSFQPKCYDSTKLYLNQLAPRLAVGVYNAVLKEFPQFKAIQYSMTSIENKIATMTLLIKDRKIMYYDERLKVWVTVSDPRQ